MLDRILRYLADAVETAEKDTREILGVYIEVGTEMYSYNGETFVNQGNADEFFKKAAVERSK
jgi:hypothetical protein